MTSVELLAGLHGGQALLDWFGGPYGFHDAGLRTLSFLDGNRAVLILDAFRINNDVDMNGFFVLDRHVEVTLHLAGVHRLWIESDSGATAIVGHLRIERDPDGYTVEWETSIGPGGSITAADVRVSLRRGDFRLLLDRISEP